MNNVINLPLSCLSAVSRVSVQVSEYRDVKDQHGNNTGSIYAVETLFADGKWVNEGHYRILAVAKVKAKQVATDRGAAILDESILAELQDWTSPMNRRTVIKAAAVVPFSYGAAKATQHADAYLLDLGEQLSVAWQEEREVYALSGAPDAQCENVFNKSRAIVTKIEETTATTLDGIKVKAQAVRWCHGGDRMVDAIDTETSDMRLLSSILDDLHKIS